MSIKVLTVTWLSTKRFQTDWAKNKNSCHQSFICFKKGIYCYGGCSTKNPESWLNCSVYKSGYGYDCSLWTSAFSAALIFGPSFFGENPRKRERGREEREEKRERERGVGWHLNYCLLVCRLFMHNFSLEFLLAKRFLRARCKMVVRAIQSSHIRLPRMARGWTCRR